MIPFWPGLIDDSAEKGWNDGLAAATYSPIMQWGIVPDADDAYTHAYWLALSTAWRLHT